MHEHIESEGYMAKIINGEYVDSKSLISDAKVRLNSAKSLLAYHDAGALQTACNNLESLINSLETNLANSKVSDLDPEITIFSQEYEQQEIKMYLYIYGECTFAQIYNHLKTHFEYRGTMPPYITRSEVYSLLKQMLKSGYLRTRRVHFKILYSLTQDARDRIMVD